MAVAYFILYTLVSLFIAWLGRRCRFGFWGYFFACLFFSPLIGVLLLVASMPVAGGTRGTTHGNGE